jgi:hypothetical protein
MGVLPVLDELIEVMKFAASLATIPLLLMLPWMQKAHIGSMWQSPGKLVAVALLSVCCLLYAVGAGSCVLGGFIQGAAFCSFRGRGGEWDPVADFYAIQAVWSSAFLFAAFLALVSALALLPGRATGWERLVFLASAGRRGAWREAALVCDPATEKYLAELRARIAGETNPGLKAEWVRLLKLHTDAARLKQELNASLDRLDDLGRAMRVVTWFAAISFSVISLGFLVPVIAGALTRETFSIGRDAARVSLDAQPELFWFNMGASLLVSAVMALGAFRAARALRAGIGRTGAENSTPTPQGNRGYVDPRSVAQRCRPRIGSGDSKAALGQA